MQYAREDAAMNPLPAEPEWPRVLDEVRCRLRTKRHRTRIAS